MSTLCFRTFLCLLVFGLAACDSGSGDAFVDGSGSSGGRIIEPTYTPPDAFVFADQTDVALGTEVESAPIMVTGIERILDADVGPTDIIIENVAATADISIVNGEYSINGLGFRRSGSVALNRDSIVVRHTSSDRHGVTTSTVLTIGGVSDSFDVTTRADTQAPVVGITFPSSNALIGTSSLTIAGTASDTSRITRVTVNGLNAVSDNEFLDWRVSIPIASGENIITVEAEDEFGNVDSFAAQTTVTNFGHQTPYIRDMVLDSANNEVIVSDLDRLVSINLASGMRSIISGPGVGSGVDFLDAVSIVLKGDRVLALDSSLDAVISVDRVTGNRAVISNAVNGTGINFSLPVDMALNAAGNSLMVTDQALNALIAVDLAAGASLGNRSVISGGDGAGGVVGTGTALSEPLAVTYNHLTGNAYVADRMINTRIRDVDLLSGNRVIASGPAVGAGVNIGWVSDMDFDGGNNRLLAVSSVSGTVIEADFSSGRGDRTIISSEVIGSGPDITSLQSVVWDSGNGRILITDDGWDSVLAVNPASGDRAILSAGTRIGSGASMNASSIAYDSANDRALVYSALVSGESVVAVNLSTGARTALASGDGISATGNMALDASGNRVLVPELNRKLIYAYDLAAGNRSVLSSDSVGSGPSLGLPEGMVVDGANNRALLIDDGLDAVISVDLSNGNRTILSNSVRGNGPAFDRPAAIAFDSATNTAYVADNGLAAIVAVNLVTGDRSILSGTANGAGVDFDLNIIELVIDPANNRLLILDSYPRRVMAVDLTSGDRVLVSDETGEGALLRAAADIALDGNGNILLSDATMDAIFQVDPTSGDKAIISK